MKKLSTKWFNKWAKKSKIKDQDLLETIDNLINGLSTADLGSNLFKIRVKREHRGKSSGFRTIVVLKKMRGLYFFMVLERMKKII